jgi:uncharacterized membrane protein
MSTKRVQANKIIDLVKGRWDLTLLSLYVLYVYWSIQSGVDRLDMVVAAPLLFFGAGYPLSFLYPNGRMVSGKRIFLSMAISCLFTIGLTAITDGSNTISFLSLIALIAAVLEAWRRRPERLQEASGLLGSGGRTWNAYIKMERNRRYTWTVSIAVLAVLLISVWAIATTPTPTERYTEFYLTGPDGGPENIPKEIVADTDYSIRIGIVNHEKRTIDYTIQIWLIESSTVNNWTEVQAAYFIHNFTVRLIHVDPSEGSEWAPQFETKYTFNLNVTGYFKMFFLLSKRGEPALPTNLTPMQNYAGDEIEELINQARMFEFQSLNINLHISEAEEALVPAIAVTNRRWA